MTSKYGLLSFCVRASGRVHIGIITREKILLKSKFSMLEQASLLIIRKSVNSLNKCKT